MGLSADADFGIAETVAGFRMLLTLSRLFIGHVDRWECCVIQLPGCPYRSVVVWNSLGVAHAPQITSG